MNLPIRVRLTAAYVVTAAVLTAIGAGIFGASVHIGVDNQLDAMLKSRAIRVATTITRDGQFGVHVQTPSGSDILIQLVAPDGLVDRSSPDLNGVALLNQQQIAQARQRGGFQSVGDGPAYRLYAQPARTAAGTWISIAATPLDLQNQLSGAITKTLAVTAAVLAVLGGIGAWVLATASLRPVERLRREVARISETDPSHPVHVPTSGDELAALATTMNALLAKIAAGLAQQRQFVADASHEIRTPLANLRTTLELASGQNRTQEDMREAIQHSERETIRLGQLVDDLLVLAAADDNAITDRLPDQPVEPLLTAAVLAAQPTAEAKNVALRVDAQPELTAVLHPGRIRQVLDNLISNALRYAPPDSDVVLTARADGDRLLIEATDDGSGFPDGFTEHAFERFRRADPGRQRAGGGNGLGLAVVRAIAKAHGGEATATNRATGGATVGISIPFGRQPTG
ncbi:MAG TPA: ATP-binding protein [Pseudonocardiaceae bacterium]